MSVIPNFAETPNPDRFPTGVEGLDRILHGGLFPGAVYILRGAPGTGKTTLAAQICFNHIGRGGKALFVTLLSESHARLIQHFRSFAFFSEAVIGDSFQMLSAFSVLDAENLSGVAKLLSREVRRHEATALIIDGIGTVDDAPHSRRDVRRFIHELQGYAQATGCICLLLTANTHDMGSPEYTMVDGIIELSVSNHVMRSERTLQVHKLRGSDFLSGSHFYRVGVDGIVAFPRTDAIHRAPMRPPAAEQAKKLSSGVAGLDSIAGGLPVASSTLVLGASGSGKTTLGLQFLMAATPQEPGLFCGFYETPETNYAKAASLGWNFQQVVASGVVEFLWEPPYGGLIDAICLRILENVTRRGVRRLFIDGLGGFEQTAFNIERVGTVLAALMNALRNHGVTSVFSWEMPDLLGVDLRSPRNNISALIDNFILLRYTESDMVLQRRLSVLKMRASNFDPAVRNFSIGSGGIEIATPGRRRAAVPPPSDLRGQPDPTAGPQR